MILLFHITRMRKNISKKKPKQKNDNKKNIKIKAGQFPMSMPYMRYPMSPSMSFQPPRHPPMSMQNMRYPPMPPRPNSMSMPNMRYPPMPPRPNSMSMPNMRYPPMPPRPNSMSMQNMKYPPMPPRPNSMSMQNMKYPPMPPRPPPGQFTRSLPTPTPNKTLSEQNNPIQNQITSPQNNKPNFARRALNGTARVLGKTVKVAADGVIFGLAMMNGGKNNSYKATKHRVNKPSKGKNNRSNAKKTLK